MWHCVSFIFWHCSPTHTVPGIAQLFFFSSYRFKPALREWAACWVGQQERRRFHTLPHVSTSPADSQFFFHAHLRKEEKCARKSAAERAEAHQFTNQPSLRTFSTAFRSCCCRCRRYLCISPLPYTNRVILKFLQTIFKYWQKMGVIYPLFKYWS